MSSQTGLHTPDDVVARLRDASAVPNVRFELPPCSPQHGVRCVVADAGRPSAGSSVLGCLR